MQGDLTSDTALPSSGQSGRWEEHNSARQLLILRAAVELIERNEVGADIPVQQIARHAGLAKSVVYRQFSGREDLDRRIRSHIVAEFVATLDITLNIADGSLNEILRRTVTAVADWAIDHPALHEFLRAGPTAEDDAVDAISSLKTDIATKAMSIIGSIAALLRVDVEPFMSLPLAVVTMVEGTLTHWVRDPAPERDRAEIVSDLATYAWFVIDGAARSVNLAVDPDAQLVDAIAALSAGVP